MTAVSERTFVISTKALLPDQGSTGQNRESIVTEAPQPTNSAASDEPTETPWAAKAHQQPFSRVGIGADVSPLGIGIKSAIVLTQYFDARGLVNYFNYNSGTLEIEGFRVNAQLHLASLEPWWTTIC